MSLLPVSVPELLRNVRPTLVDERISEGEKPNSAISLLQLCTHFDELNQLHALLLKTSIIRHPPVLCRLISSLSADFNRLPYARKLFNSFGSRRTTFIYNTMIKAYARSNDPEPALLLYSDMIDGEDYLLPDQFTFTFVLSACTKLRAVLEGKQAHAQIVKSPEKAGTHARNSLMAFYTKVGDCGLSGLLHLFDEIGNPDLISWNCLLDGFVKSGDIEGAREVFDRMPCKDVVSWTTMLVGCAEAGLLNEARRLFDEMPVRNVITWSAMMSGLVRHGFYKEALLFFREFQDSEIEADNMTMSTLLSACANLGSLDQGRWLHAYVKKRRIEMDAHLSTALVDMYAKSGRIDIALEIFREATNKKVFLWNAMLGGLAMHSRGGQATELFSEMIGSGTQPNEITFICALSACSHSGLIDHGLQIFGRLLKDQMVTVTTEHYGCLVDLLGRAGRLYEAKRVIQTMPVEADGNILRALLGACVLHGDVQLGEYVGRLLIELEPGNDGNYVLMSNVYAMGKRWEDVAWLRKAMKERGFRKKPGCSSIELNGVPHEFIAGDGSHHRSEEIYEALDSMVQHLSQEAEL